jgi:asparagine synthase (glutamine-hydrolysing)
MANFVVIVDADEARRSSVTRQILPGLAPVDGLDTVCRSVNGCTVAWAASPSAPVRVAVSDDGLAVIWGDAISAGSDARMDADSLPNLPLGRGEPPTLAYDGYHAAFCYRAGAGLLAGSDLLGLFPIYFASSGGVVMVASSPRFFHDHPMFGSEIDDEGLVGILLSGCAIEHQTLARGVRRLRAGNNLWWTPTEGAREVRAYQLPMPVRAGTFEEHAVALDSALAAAVRRHAPASSSSGLLLSGGLDSRMLAGYLADNGNEVSALTLGRRTDDEIRCAARVARALGFEHRTFEIPDSNYPRGALLQARWEQLATGFASVHMWGALEPLRSMPQRIVNGYFVDAILSRAELLEREVAFDFFFSRFNRRGLERDQLVRLLKKKGLKDQVAATVRRIQTLFETSAADTTQRTWRFHILNPERLRLGTVPWRLTFASWPVLPILDRAVLDLLGSFPDATLAFRRAEEHIVRTRFPRLAALPLDRNSPNTLPLVASTPARVRHALARPFDALRARVPLLPERRRFHRIFDFDRAGWRQIRQLAEPYRDQLADLFDMDELARYLPGPDTPTRLEHPIMDSYGRKLLIGLMLWSADR